MTRRTFQTTTLASGLAFAMKAPAQAIASAPKIRIGQIGTKHAHAGGQFAALRAAAGYEVVGIVEPDEERRRHVEKEQDYAGAQWLSEEQLLNTPGLQAVAVETEVGGLLATAEKVVNAGLHLHLDKPDRFPFRVAGSDLPQGIELTKATKPVVIVADPASEKKPVLVFTEIKVEGDEASVRYRYDVEKVRGASSLKKRDGHWVLTRSRVTEH